MQRKPAKAELVNKITPLMVSAASAVLMAKAFLETVKPIVEKYSSEVLQKHKFTNRGEIERLSEKKIDRKIEEYIVLDRNHTFKLADSDFLKYWEDCKVARDKSGLKVSDPDHCPLLIAEHQLVNAESALIDAMEPITGINSESPGLYLNEHRAKLVDLTLRMLAGLDLLVNPLTSTRNIKSA